MKTKHFGRLSFFLVLLAAVPLLLSRGPRKFPSGCDFGQILGIERNQTIVICSADRRTPEILAQLKRLSELASEDARHQRELERFVQRVNATATLVKGRTDELARSVSELLHEFAQHSDSRVIQDIATLTDKMEQLEARLDALQRDPATAHKVGEVLGGGVGEDLATLRPDKASQALEAIGLLDKKIEDLAVRIDCNSATPEQMQLAIAAHNTDRVISMWRCRPENAVADPVELQFSRLFGKQEFPESRAFLENILSLGWNFIVDIAPQQEFGLMNYGWSPVWYALTQDNIEGLELLRTHTNAAYWRKYPRVLSDMLDSIPWYMSAPTETRIRAIALLRKAGTPYDSNDNLAFRKAYKNWLQWECPEDLRHPLFDIDAVYHGSTSEYDVARQASPSESARLRAGWKAASEALAPSSPDVLRAAKSKVVTEFIGGDLRQANAEIQQMSDKLSGAWWRKLPETPANLQEAARRQAINGFDSYGYVRVAAGDLRDTDLLPTWSREPVGYPNCGCWVLKQVRERLSRAMRRKSRILEFKSSHE